MNKESIIFKPKKWLFRIQFCYYVLFLLLVTGALCWFLIYRVIPSSDIQFCGLFFLLCCVVYYWRITKFIILLQYYNHHKNCELIVDKENNKIIYIKSEQTIEIQENDIINLTIIECRTLMTDKYYYEIYIRGETHPMIVTSMLCKKLEKHLNLVYNTKLRNNMLIHKKVKKECIQRQKEDISRDCLKQENTRCFDIIFTADKKAYRKTIFIHIAGILIANIMIYLVSHNPNITHNLAVTIIVFIILNLFFITSLVSYIKFYRVNRGDSLVIHKDLNTITYYTQNKRIDFSQDDITTFKAFWNSGQYYYEIHISQYDSPIVITSLFCKNLNEYISKKYELVKKKKFVNFLNKQK